MKKNFSVWKALLILFGIVLLSAILFLPLNRVSQFFAIATVLNFIFFSYLFNNIYNPVSLFMSLFLLMIGCSQARLTPIEQTPFSWAIWCVLWTVIGCFYSVVLFGIMKKWHVARPHKVRDSLQINSSTIFYSNLFITLFEVILYWYSMHKIGSIPLFDDYARVNVMPVLINNYLMTLLVLPIFFIIFNVIYIIQSRAYGYFVFNAIYLGLLMLLGGRINVFIPIITSLFYILIHYNVSKNHRTTLFVTGGAILILLSFLMLFIPIIRTKVHLSAEVSQQSVRQSRHQLVAKYYEDKTEVSLPLNSPSSGKLPFDLLAVWGNLSEFSAQSMMQKQERSDTKYYEKLYFYNGNNELRSLKFTPSIKLPSALLPIWINLSTELYGFNNLVNSLEKTHDYKYGRVLLTGPLHFITKYFMPEVSLEPATIGNESWLNIITFMQKPYMDFGIYGVAGFILLFTLGYMKLYQRMQQRRTFIVTLFYSYFCMNILFMIFDNPFYYSTIIVNVVLLFLFTQFMTTDWLTQFKRVK